MREDLGGPVMVIIGDAVAGANFERSEPLSRVRAATPRHMAAAVRI